MQTVMLTEQTFISAASVVIYQKMASLLIVDWKTPDFVWGFLLPILTMPDIMWIIICVGDNGRVYGKLVLGRAYRE